MSSRHTQATGSYARSIALSDGIFAVAITLLVLDLRLPDIAISSDRALQERLIALIPGVLSFNLSFLVVAVYWLSHHRLFQLLREHDRVIEYANLVFLLTVCFIPAPTSVLGRYNDFPSAVALYAATQVLTSATLTFMWWFGVLRSARHPGDERSVALFFTVRSLVTTCIFVVSIPIALMSPAAGRLVWLAIPVAYGAIARVVRARVPGNLRPSI